MNLNPSSIARKVSDKLGVKGVVAVTILTTAVLEFGSQFIENASFTPSTVKNIADRQIMAGAPFLGRIDVRDAVVLSPSITQGMRVLKKGKPNIKIILANYGSKVAMRMLGVNPLPDKHKPAQSARKTFSYQLPART